MNCNTSIFSDLQPVILGVDCNNESQTLRVQWTQPSTLSDLVIEKYIIRVYPIDDDVLAENDTEGTDFSIQSDCDYGRVCIQANTSAGMGCETCESKGKRFVMPYC